MCLLGVGHKNLAVESVDTEWSVTVRKAGVGKAVLIHLVESLVVSFDAAGVEIGYVKEVMTIGDADRHALVNGAVVAVIRAVIHCLNCMRAVDRRVPS